MLRLAVAFSVAILAFDLIVSLIARTFSITYAQFFLLALVLFVGFGLYAGNRLAWARALIAVGIAAVVDMTLGTLVAAVTGAAKPLETASGLQLWYAGVFGAALELVFGGIGVFVGRRADAPLE